MFVQQNGQLQFIGHVPFAALVDWQQGLASSLVTVEMKW
jgi:hypothetical protein